MVWNQVFWDKTLCYLVTDGAACLHLQTTDLCRRRRQCPLVNLEPPTKGLRITSLKVWILCGTAVRTSCFI